MSWFSPSRSPNALPTTDQSAQFEILMVHQYGSLADFSPDAAAKHSFEKEVQILRQVLKERFSSEVHWDAGPTKRILDSNPAEIEKKARESDTGVGSGSDMDLPGAPATYSRDFLMKIHEFSSFFDRNP